MASLATARSVLRLSKIQKIALVSGSQNFVFTSLNHHHFKSSCEKLHTQSLIPHQKRTNNSGSHLKFYKLVGSVLCFCTFGLGYAYDKHRKEMKDIVADLFYRLTSVSAATFDDTSLPRSKRFNFIADVVEKAAPAVVFIEIRDRRAFSKYFAISNGSGFVVRQDGLIMTNAHVVANKAQVVVRLQDGRELDGFVVAVDPVSDLAAVRINATGLPVLKLGKSSNLRAGEWVIALGSPLALNNTVTCGIVSSVSRRSQELGLNKEMDYIQTDAIINFGNSGGPLVNLDGEVIGINTMKVTAGISFAIPSDHAITFLAKVDELLKRGQPQTRSWFGLGSETKRKRYMGITMLTLTPDILLELRGRLPGFPDITAGVFVQRIIIGSPAHKSGLQIGDIIVEINGKSIQSAADVYRAIESSELLHMAVYRGSVKLKLDIAVEDVN